MFNVQSRELISIWNLAYPAFGDKSALYSYTNAHLSKELFTYLGKLFKNSRLWITLSENQASHVDFVEKGVISKKGIKFQKLIIELISSTAEFKYLK